MKLIVQFLKVAETIAVAGLVKDFLLLLLPLLLRKSSFAIR